MPPKKNKQTPRNAFFHFMMEFKGRQGNKFSGGMKDVAAAASPHWNRMTKEQKRPYEERAAYEKNNIRGGKLTSDGVEVEQLEMEEALELSRTQDMREQIKYTLTLANQQSRLQEELFFIIHVNNFCYCSGPNRYYPAEIAICAFNLEEGVLESNVFHRIIKPGALPLGYAAEATLNSRETHQLPPPMTGENENNLEQVYREMKTFLSDKLLGSKRYPVLYADEKMMKMIQQVLDDWAYDDGETKSIFRVYNLQYMFTMLRNTVAGSGTNIWGSDTYSSREIEKDVYAYAKNLACDYHDVANVTVFCSRSVVMRYAYIICDNCCTDLGISIMPGVHVPSTARTHNFRASSNASLASSKSSTRSSNLRPSIRDDDSEGSVISFSSKSEWDRESTCSDSSSSVFTLDNKDNFPSLGISGKSRPKPAWLTYEDESPNLFASQGSGKSYSSAMGTSGLSSRPADIPSSFLNSNFEKLSIDSENSFDSATPRGIGKKGNFQNDCKEFPVLGRGRTFGRPSNSGT